MAATPAPTVSAEDAGRIRAGAGRLLEALETAPDLEYEPQSLPIAEELGPGTSDLGRRFRELAPTLPWTTGRGDHEGTDRGLVVLNDLFDLGTVTAGMLCVAPAKIYPEHDHPPQELYVLLDGTAEWRFGGADDYLPLAPGTTLYNHPSDRHGIRVGDEAVVAMYVLWDDPT